MKIRRAAFVAVPVLAALVTGCTAAMPSGPGDDAAPSASAPAASASASVPASAGAVSAPDELTFDAGDDLNPRLAAQWGDALISDTDYTLTSPDDGKGNWAYTENATQCEVRFWQGDVRSIDSADDRGLSDAVLATWLRVGLNDVSNAAEDDVVGYLPGASGRAAVRVIAGTAASGGTSVAAARGLRAIGAGLVVHVSCPPGEDARTLYASLRTHKITIFLGPRS